MDYRILGPLEVSDGDRPLALGGERQRALLAILLLHAGEVVSVDRLIDDLWGERSPSGAPKALQAHISRLRKALDADGAGPPTTDGEPTGSSSPGVLVTRGHGYLLRVQRGELDLDRFQTIVQAGRRALVSGDPRRAADTLRAGLALWRGLPLADFAYEPFAQAPIAELAELRLGAVEDRVEADLVLGRHEQHVGELAALVKQDPLRERLRMHRAVGTCAPNMSPVSRNVSGSWNGPGPGGGRPAAGYFTRRLAESWLRDTLAEVRRGTCASPITRPGSSSAHPRTLGAGASRRILGACPS